ncbi:hypothetical protein [Flavobacterium subsaxonicum]|uniref:Peptidylprolyl isomerase n=1 Tax=Flavobacterium subsaxonicum WB 4.1-42 = DSM 21790 TaxID=1121898 RepID=A0A0A2MVU5_9FLAO|nr:hypothetical protein [Flavobacterium subsaxonicum]KGO92350.1 hypothetical protein Q766_12845 [Flavobacterium subsaxonicum WB 4.1-42 = DSM 21790]
MKLRKLLLFTFLLLACNAIAQSGAFIDLQWRLGKNDSISYKTTMEPFLTDTAAVESPFKGMMKGLAKMSEGQTYRTILKPNLKNISAIDIAMCLEADKDTLGSKGQDDFTKLFADRDQENATKKEKRKDKKKKERARAEPDSLVMRNLFRSMASLNKNVVLRGRISKGGEILSTYYKNGQVNLIAVLFELPNKPVKIGEFWKLNVHFIEMDQNFVADSAYSYNKVFIEKIEEVGGKKIAVIKYDITEYVSGDFNNPLGGMMGAVNEGKAFMKLSHTATGRFSVTDGRWESYDGVMKTESNMGFLGGKGGTVFKLEL